MVSAEDVVSDAIHDDELSQPRVEGEVSGSVILVQDGVAVSHDALDVLLKAEDREPRNVKDEVSSTAEVGARAGDRSFYCTKSWHHVSE